MLAIGDDKNGWQVFSFERANQDGGKFNVEGAAEFIESVAKWGDEAVEST